MIKKVAIDGQVFKCGASTITNVEYPKRHPQKRSKHIYMSGSDMWGIWYFIDVMISTGHIYSDPNVWINEYGSICVSWS